MSGPFTGKSPEESAIASSRPSSLSNRQDSRLNSLRSLHSHHANAQQVDLCATQAWRVKLRRPRTASAHSPVRPETHSLSTIGPRIVTHMSLLKLVGIELDG